MKTLPSILPLSSVPVAPPRRPWALALCAVVMAVVIGQPAPAQTCDFSGCGRIDCQESGTPVRPVPQNFWGDLQAVDPNPLPPGRDATVFDEFREAYSKYAWYLGIDTENGFLFTALSHGIQVWGTQTDPANPELLGSVVATVRSVPLPVWVDSAEEKWPLRGVDAPTGVDSVVALTGRAGIGISIWDTSIKNSPKLVYQNHKKDSEQVYAATIGGVRYAFMAADGGQTGGGLYAFNMSQALGFNRCVEAVPAPGETVQCPGVYVGKIGTRNPVRFVHGVDDYVVVSSGSGRGFDIWNVSTPAAPQLELSGLGDQSVYGVAMWKQGSKYYLALRSEIFNTAQRKLINSGQIYDVTCIAGSCSGPLEPAIWTSPPLDTGTPNFFVTHSKGGGLDYLYFGSDNRCSGGEQREWLFDVSNPTNPRDLSSVGYWRWYYRGNANGVSGYNNLMPRMGKFSGDHFYRAGLSIMDIHKRTGGVPPTVDFSWSPAEIYEGAAGVGTAVSFQDNSFPLPTAWSWNFGGGVGGVTTDRNPQGVTFPTAGQFQISLNASNGVGSGNKTKTLTVLPAAPAVAGVGAVPASPSVCQPVTLTATGVTGRPPLTLGWEVRSSTNQLMASGTGNPFVWADTSAVLPGAYTATVTVGNGAGTATKSSVVNVTALDQFPGSFAPTADPFTAGTVQFHVNATGATAWRWDFDDDANPATANFGEWTTDPVNGPNPVHSYPTIGIRKVRVEIDNCRDAPKLSDELTVDILVTTPLHAEFHGSVFCSRGVCFADTGQAITFTDASTGADFRDYDWNGDGDFTDAGDQANQTSPVTSHTYTVAGEFAPRLRVRRGAEEDVFTHGRIIVSSPTGGGGNDPSISVGGPSSGTVNQALTFSASASNCSAAASGWSWSVSGGAITGSSNGNSITVSWASPGNKSVQATNSGCGSASGSKSVVITGNDGGGGGTLAASFSFAPANPTPGQAVTFNGNGSTGSPSQFSWTFGDGGNGTGPTATHTYVAAGNYTVKLTVTKSGSGPGCFSGICAAETSKVVSVGGTPPPPPLDASFTPAGVDCINVGGFNLCTGQTGAAVTLTAAAADATSYSWSFGDNTTGNGRTVTHTWNNPGSFVVSLTVAKGEQTASKSQTFQINGQPVATVRSVVLPWIAQTRGALVQSSDLYVHNPTATAMKVKLEFRKRGQTETTPPQATRTIAPGATLFIADVLDELFDRENIAGFVTVKVEEGSAEPVITSFNTTFGDDGQFGQTIPGISMSRTGASAAAERAGEPVFQHLIGLNDTEERLSYFGVSNPADAPATYRLRFFDHDGHEIGNSAQFVVPRFGQRQFQRKEIEEELGVSDEADYRVMVESADGSQIFPYAANLRKASEDPSFVGVGNSRHSTSFLVGALSTPGLLGSRWETDVVLTNPAAVVVETDVTFTRVGFGSAATTPVHIVLQPGETQRLSNVVADRWDIDDAVGVLRFDSVSPSGVFPIIQGESYDNSRPAKRFGQSMMAMAEGGAAGVGQGQYLAGLRQDETYRTTLWIFNPSTSPGLVDLVYRGLDGVILGRLDGVALPAGRSRQLRPSDHPLPATGVTDGFTLQVIVRGGKALAAAQVVNNATNDPAYIGGETR